MKSILHIIIIVLSSLLFNSCCFFGNCNTESPDPHVDRYKAIILERSVFENSIQAQPQQTVIKSGKIYIKDNMMFLNETNKGFHVYNYTNPETPVKLGFIKILGATDIAVRNETIYINQATDLVTLNYNSTNNTIAILHRNRNVFPQKLSPDGFIQYTVANEIIVDWILN